MDQREQDEIGGGRPDEERREQGTALGRGLRWDGGCARWDGGCATARAYRSVEPGRLHLRGRHHESRRGRTDAHI